MKIVLVQGAFLPIPPIRGGAVEKRWYLLAKEFVKQGHEVIHICKSFENMLDEETVDGVLIKRKSGFNISANFIVSNFKDFYYTTKILSLIPKDTDVLISNTFWLPILAPKKLKTKIMVDVARIPKGQMPFYKKAKTLRANSTPVAKAIKSELPSHLHNKVITIPNPLTFLTDTEFSMPPKTKTILYTGRIHPEKGIELLVQAFAELNLKDWKLEIIGPYEISDGGGGKKYLEKLKKMRTIKQLSWNLFNVEELNTYYKKASIFVYPSVAEKGETFGLAPLEAMAWGAIPIVSDLSCFKDFIKDGINGRIFDHRCENPVDALSSIMQDLALNISNKESMRIASIKVRKSHSIPSIAKLFIDEFHDTKNRV